MLSKITDAEPQVADYPFTTKGIQIGHFEKRWRHYQIIDTPGLLDRPVGEMNDIELNAMVALEDLADAILFIFDASETCGYGLPNQFNLLEEIKQIFDTPIVYLFNKMDIADYDGARHDYIQEYIDKTEDPLLISALEGEGVEEIVRLITRVKKIDRILDVEVEEEDDEHYFDLT